MRVLAIAAAVALAPSCWTSTPSPPPVAPRVGTTARPTAAARALASQLADRLREPSDPMFMERFLDRQIVLVDPDGGTVEVLCDVQALAAIARFSDLLNDPDRPAASCGVGRTNTVWCMQDGEQGTGALMLEFRRTADDWVLVGGVLPPTTAVFRDQRRLLAEYRAKLAAPGCPP